MPTAIGEADATFVYQGDIPDDIRDRVRVVEIRENLNGLVSYPIAMTQSSQNPGLTQERIDLVLGNEGQAVLDKYRFAPLSRRRSRSGGARPAGEQSRV